MMMMIDPTNSQEDNQEEDDDDPNMTSSNILYASGRKRHFRRCNNEIKKSYLCPYAGCGKFYGSEGSLNLHMKIKHLAGSKTDREKFARDTVLAIRSGACVAMTESQVEQMKILPPGLFEECAKEIGFLTEFLTHPTYKHLRQQLDPFLLTGSYHSKPFAAPLPPPPSNSYETDIHLGK